MGVSENKSFMVRPFLETPIFKLLTQGLLNALIHHITQQFIGDL